jgi:hypothetical protein
MNFHLRIGRLLGSSFPSIQKSVTKSALRSRVARLHASLATEFVLGFFVLALDRAWEGSLGSDEKVRMGRYEAQGLPDEYGQHWVSMTQLTYHGAQLWLLSRFSVSIFRLVCYSMI